MSSSKYCYEPPETPRFTHCCAVCGTQWTDQDEAYAGEECSACAEETAEMSRLTENSQRC